MRGEDIWGGCELVDTGGDGRGKDEQQGKVDKVILGGYRECRGLSFHPGPTFSCIFNGKGAKDLDGNGNDRAISISLAPEHVLREGTSDRKWK